MSGPCNNRGANKKDKVWSKLGRMVDKIGNGYRLMIMRDLNGWIGNIMWVGVTGALGIDGKNKNGK